MGREQKMSSEILEGSDSEQLLLACISCLRMRTISGYTAKGEDPCAAEKGESNERRVACSRELARLAVVV